MPTKGLEFQHSHPPIANNETWNQVNQWTEASFSCLQPFWLWVGWFWEGAVRPSPCSAPALSPQPLQPPGGRRNNSPQTWTPWGQKLDLTLAHRMTETRTATLPLTCSFPVTCWGCPAERQAQGRSSACGVVPLGILPPEPVWARPPPGALETYPQASTESPRTSGNIWGAEEGAEWGDVRQGHSAPVLTQIDRHSLGRRGAEMVNFLDGVVVQGLGVSLSVGTRQFQVRHLIVSLCQLEHQLAANQQVVLGVQVCE